MPIPCPRCERSTNNSSIHAPFAAVLQTVIEADDEIGHGDVFLARQINNSIVKVMEKFEKIAADNRFVEVLGPRIVSLHVPAS